MKRWLSVLVLAAMWMPNPALAGERRSVPVRIVHHSGGGGWAEGTLGGARNSASAAERINCVFYGIAAGGSLGTCTAVNAGGTLGTCSFTANPHLTEALATIANDSYVMFAWGRDNQCTLIVVDNNSVYEPKR